MHSWAGSTRHCPAGRHCSSLTFSSTLHFLELAQGRMNPEKRSHILHQRNAGQGLNYKPTLNEITQQAGVVGYGPVGSGWQRRGRGARMSQVGSARNPKFAPAPALPTAAPSKPDQPNSEPAGTRSQSSVTSDSDHWAAHTAGMLPHRNQEFCECYKKFLAPQRIIRVVEIADVLSARGQPGQQPEAPPCPGTAPWAPFSLAQQGPAQQGQAQPKGRAQSCGSRRGLRPFCPTAMRFQCNTDFHP